MKNIKLSAITFLMVLGFFCANALAQDAVNAYENRGETVKGESTDTPGAANLAPFVVNNNGDATDAAPGDGVCETAAGNGVCTLRAAIAEANALAGTDTITFDAGVTSISLAAGQISITSNMNIIGSGASLLTVQNTAALSTTSRVFNITNFTVSISGMTISGGNLTGNGGGINNTGTLTLSNCVISNNTASALGGGIRSTNTLTINNSVIHNNSSTASTSGGVSFAGTNLTIRNTTVRNNTSFGNGGGLNVSASASATISNSTVSNNTAGASSGGIFLNRGTITNSTISGNTANGALATDGGGGVRIQAGANSVTIVASTITGNTAPNAASGARSGIWHETGTLTLSNTIVAANVAQDIQRDGTGVITSGGFNLIGENTSVTTEFPAGLPSGTDYVGTDAMPLNPMLGALAGNGGQTQTHALLEGSPAIDKGSAFGLSVDQRNYARVIDLPGVPNTPTGDGTDIGAFEYQSAPISGFSISGRVTDASGSGISRTVVILTDGGGNTRTTITSSFGYYRFDAVEAGATFTVSVSAKGYVFPNPAQVVTVSDNLSGIDFMAE